MIGAQRLVWTRSCPLGSSSFYDSGFAYGEGSGSARAPSPAKRPWLFCTHTPSLGTDLGSQGRAGYSLPWDPDLSRSQELGCVQILGTQCASVAQDSEGSSKGDSKREDRGHFPPI